VTDHGAVPADRVTTASGDVHREREILRQASVALSGRVVTMWEVSPSRELVPRLSSVENPPYHATVLDIEGTLLRWKTPLAPGGRWVGCRLNEQEWCVAPVRREPAAPPPDGIERRSRERITLELAGLCVGATEVEPRVEAEPAVPQPGDAVADPVTVALASLKLSAERIEAEAHLDAAFRATLLDELVAVSGGLELAKRRAVSLEARIAGAAAASFDPAEIAQASVVLERPAARRRGVVLHLVGSGGGRVVRGDAYAVSYVLRSLIRCAVSRARSDTPPIVIRVEPIEAGICVSVEEGTAPDPLVTPDQAAGVRRGVPALPLLRKMIHETCQGRVDLRPLAHGGRAAAIVLWGPPDGPGPVGQGN